MSQRRWLGRRAVPPPMAKPWRVDLAGRYAGRYRTLLEAKNSVAGPGTFRPGGCIIHNTVSGERHVRDAGQIDWRREDLPPAEDQAAVSPPAHAWQRRRDLA